MKKIIVVVCGVAVLLASIYVLFFVNFYSKQQLDDARIKAIDHAREGNYDYALNRLETLVKHDPNNKVLWYDYLTVLSWSESYRLFYTNMNRVDFKEAPSYFFDAAVEVITNEQHEEIGSELLLLRKLFKSTKFLNSQQLNHIFKHYTQNSLGSMFLQALEEERPNFVGLFDLQWANFVQIARSGRTDVALEFFERQITSKKTTPNFLADYILVLFWAQNYGQVIEVARWQESEQLPEYGHEYIAKSLSSLGQYRQALSVYEQLIEGDYSKEIEWLRSSLAKSSQNESINDSQML